MRRRAGRKKGRRRIWRLGIGALALVGLLGVALVLPWRWIAPPTTAFIVREQMERARVGGHVVHHRWVPWPDLSPHLAIAVIASEDQRFSSHNGFDVESIARALQSQPHRPRGASTISQQVAKNLFLWPGRSLVRKGLEAHFTLLIELLWPKRRILEVYLNVVEFGPGIFGAGAASERFFGKPASELTPRESALLAAVLPSPKRMSPAEPSPFVRERAGWIQRAVDRLGGVGYLSDL